MPKWTEPRLLAGIRNFNWAVPGLVARGEQPLLELATFQALHEQGIGTVLSLRPDREPPPNSARRQWPEYHVEDERELVEAAGMQFRHVELQDFLAPSPDEVARALSEVDSAVEQRPAVYVHCRAGAGRAVVVSGAWMVAHGRTGDDTAAMYERMMLHVASLMNFSDQETREMQRRVGQPYVWWALREIVAALGSPVSRELSRLLPPELPPGAEAWTYRDALKPWRVRRASLQLEDCGLAAD
jgi:protein tyrosine phosphatase (PTP) superfamily phosphohydrolase (DUF442 family)